MNESALVTIGLTVKAMTLTSGISSSASAGSDYSLTVTRIVLTQ